MRRQNKINFFLNIFFFLLKRPKKYYICKNKNTKEIKNKPNKIISLSKVRTYFKTTNNEKKSKEKRKVTTRKGK